MVEARSPTPAVHGVVRWRLIDLAQWVFDEIIASRSPNKILSRELRARWAIENSRRGRCHHAHDEAAVAAFKKSPGHPGDDRRDQRREATRTLVPRRSPHRVRKNKVTRRQLGGTRHATPFFALKDQRTASAYIFGAIMSTPLGKAARVSSSHPATLEAMTAPPPGDRRRRRARRSRGSVCGSGRMACHREAGCARKLLRSVTPCRPSHPSSIPSKTFGNTCAIIGSPTGFSPTTMTSSIIAASTGTNWLNARGSSCRSERAGGPMGRTFRDLVLARTLACSRWRTPPAPTPHRRAGSYQGRPALIRA